MNSSRESLLSQGQLESNGFKIYCYKIVPCAKKFGHDWSECPFAHEGEKATRRCPAMYPYSSIVCPDVRQSKPCPRGDVCPYSHSIFEYWMHPARFRAQICSFGADCNRRICFFAHAQAQLRVPSEPVVEEALAARAPYLQGRVCPKSRYALYPEQLPSAVPLQPGGGGMPPQGAQLLAMQQRPEFLAPGPQQGLPQMVYMDAGGHAGMAATVAASGADAAAGGGVELAMLQQQQQQQQQWAVATAPAGGGVMYVPAGPSQPAGGGLGYYITPGVAGGGGSGLVGGGPGLPAFSGAMVMQGGGMVQLAGPAQVAAGAAGPAYGGRQAMQLVSGVGPDSGGYPAFSVGQAGAGMGAAVGGGGGMVQYAQPMYVGPSCLPPQQPWALQGVPQQPGPGPGGQPQQQQQQQQQQLQQYVHMEGGEGMRPPGGQEGFVLAQPPFSAAPQQPHRLGSLDPSGGYAVMVPAGGPGMVAQGHRGGPGAGGGGGAPAAGGDAACGPGVSSVDDIAQQMGGWRIS